MKQIQILLKASTAIALLALVVSCASTQTAVENKESMLVAAGFKVITPKTPAHQQKLQQLPPGKIAMIQKSGKTFYVYPDAAHNQAYVGGPQEYQAYQQARLANKLAEENLETAEMYQDANMNWGAWGGWKVALRQRGDLRQLSGPNKLPGNGCCNESTDSPHEFPITSKAPSRS
jgi:hypothetical protein